MAEKISTLILKVDLDCHKCYNKIRKILCCLQDQERIMTISYDNRNNIVVIAGPFDPQRLCCRIRCKGGKVIKDIHIVDAAGGKPVNMSESPPPPPLPVNTGKKKKPKKDKCKEMPPPAESPPPLQQHEQPPETMRPASPQPLPAQPAPPDREVSAMVPAVVEEEKPRERPAELEPSPPQERPPTMELPPPVACTPVVEKPSPRAPYPPAVKPYYPVDMTATTTMVEIPSWPAAPPARRPCGGACCAPCYQGCRCGSCGRVYGYSVPSARPPPLLPPPCYGGATTVPYCGGYSGCRLVNEEDPTASSVM